MSGLKKSVLPEVQKPLKRALIAWVYPCVSWCCCELALWRSTEGAWLAHQAGLGTLGGLGDIYPDVSLPGVYVGFTRLQFYARVSFRTRSFLEFLHHLSFDSRDSRVTHV